MKENTNYLDAYFWVDNSAIFAGIGGDDYYKLKVRFISANEYEIFVIAERYIHDEKLRNEKKFTNRFDESNVWIRNERKINLVDNFNDLVEEVKFIINLTAEIIQAK